MSRFGLQGTLPSDLFASLTALTSLDLSNNSLTSPLPSISMLTQLHDLYVKFGLLMEDKKKILFLSYTSYMKSNVSDTSCFTFGI